MQVAVVEVCVDVAEAAIALAFADNETRDEDLDGDGARKRLQFRVDPFLLQIRRPRSRPVSYTHLTLPTKRIV